MQLSHLSLDVYRVSLEFVEWADALLQALPARSAVRNQLERASTNVPLNIAEGNMRRSPRERYRYIEIALGSAVECAAILDVITARRLRTPHQVTTGRALLERVIAMLIRLRKRIEQSM